MIFRKNKKNYTLKIITKNKETKHPTPPKAIPFVRKHTSPSRVNLPREIEETNFRVEKKDVYEYAKNPKKIWKNIRIKSYRVDNKLIGYKV